MKLLVPLDHSDAAWAALEHVLQEHPSADLHLLHVLDPYDTGLVADGYATKYVVEGRREDAEKLLERVRAATSDHQGTIETETVVGQPAREIIAAAEKTDASRIVMGSHGRGGLTRILLGSVAEEVVRRAALPVTIVR